jgi:hypothetical protein
MMVMFVLALSPRQPLPRHFITFGAPNFRRNATPARKSRGADPRKPSVWLIPSNDGMSGRAPDGIFLVGSSVVAISIRAFTLVKSDWVKA